MLREPIVVLCLLAHIGAVSLLAAGCAKPAPLPIQPAPLPVLGPKPGTHGAWDHCEVFVTECTGVFRGQRRIGCWVIHFNAEVRGRDADLVCEVASDIGHAGAQSAPGIASLSRVDGTQIPLAPPWGTSGFPKLADNNMRANYIDPCEDDATRAHRWQWRVRTTFCLISEEDPRGLVRLALNGEALMHAIDPAGRRGAVTLESPPATFNIPAVDQPESTESPESGANLGG